MKRFYQTVLWLTEELPSIIAGLLLVVFAASVGLCALVLVAAALLFCLRNYRDLVQVVAWSGVVLISLAMIHCAIIQAADWAKKKLSRIDCPQPGPQLQASSQPEQCLRCQQQGRR